MSAVPSCAPTGVYRPRRPQASPLFRLVSDHCRACHHAYEERFAETYGDWRPVVREVADKCLACGVLGHGFARVCCDACTHEYLLAFSCKARYFCPSCHAKELALWTLWLEDSLPVAGVPHRQVVLTIPKRLRPWCLYRRTLLGDLARVAARTVTAAVRALTGEFALAVGIVGCIQTHGALANWHPHISMIATDGGFRVRYRSDKVDGPTAGTETVDPLEFLARLTAHLPNKHQVMTRYYGYYANRVRGARRRREARRPRAPARAHFADRSPRARPRTLRRLPLGPRRRVPDGRRRRRDLHAADRMGLRDRLWPLRSAYGRLTHVPALLQFSLSPQRPQRRSTGLTPAHRRVNNVSVIHPSAHAPMHLDGTLEGTRYPGRHPRKV